MATLYTLISTLVAISGGVSGPCHRVASPSGSDRAAGSAAAPFRTVQKLVNSLARGQTGCLKAGSYRGNVRFGHGGRAGRPLTLTGYHGETATVVGRLWVARGANHVVVKGLHLNGDNQQDLPSPTINANDVTFTNDEVTNGHSAICFDVGSDTYGRADGTVISHDRIHGCGTLPPTNHEHGIYVADATATRIEWNLIYDNADRGVQLYPDAQDTIVAHNVIDGNGEGLIFSGNDATASSHNVVIHNIISNARVRSDVESNWSPKGPIGSGNVASENCVYGGEQTVDLSSGGFIASDNIVADPGYTNAAKGDYIPRQASPCADVLTGSGLLALNIVKRARPGAGKRPGFGWLGTGFVEPVLTEISRVDAWAGAAVGAGHPHSPAPALR